MIIGKIEFKVSYVTKKIYKQEKKKIQLTTKGITPLYYRKKFGMVNSELNRIFLQRIQVNNPPMGGKMDYNLLNTTKKYIKKNKK